MYKVVIRLRGTVLSLFLLLVIVTVMFSGSDRADNLITKKSKAATLNSHQDASLTGDKDDPGPLQIFFLIPAMYRLHYFFVAGYEQIPPPPP